MTRFLDQPPRSTTVLWSITGALLVAWAGGLATANRMGGLVDVFLIAGAVMVFVTLFLGRRTIS